MGFLIASSFFLGNSLYPENCYLRGRSLLGLLIQLNMDTKHSLLFLSVVFVLLIDSTKKSKLSSLSPDLSAVAVPVFIFQKKKKRQKTTSVRLLNFKLVSVRQERAVHLFLEIILFFSRCGLIHVGCSSECWSCGFLHSVVVLVLAETHVSQLPALRFTCDQLRLLKLLFCGLSL